MPDYASILRRSISGLADPIPEMREAVYQRARAALARQLTAVDPPLSTREVESQHQELEDAVARLEAEFAPQESTSIPGFGPSAGKDDFFNTPQVPAVERRPAVSGDMSEARAPAYEDDDEEFDDDGERGSRLPVLIGLVAVLLVAVAAGAYVYSERDKFFGLSGSRAPEDTIASVETPPPSTVPTPEPTEPPKRADRLTNGSDTAPVGAEGSDTASAPEAAAPPATTPAPGIESAPATAAAGAPTTSADGLPLENLSGLQDNNQPAQTDTNLVQQRAIYYFQGAEGQAGQATDGTATWAEITKDNRPAIQATVKIAPRNVTVTITIYKNYDSALPASHLVEVQFNGTLSDSPIQRVPALVLKQTEQARGQPLAGAAVPVTNELFWIALSDQNDDVSRNVQLLKEGSWFDLPILFSDQTRALITFEKGVPGDKVFQTVMAGWTPT